MIITDLNYMEVAVESVQGAGAPSSGGQINIDGSGAIFEFSGSISSKAGKTREHGTRTTYATNVTKAGAGVVDGGFSLNMSGGAHG